MDAGRRPRRPPRSVPSLPTPETDLSGCARQALKARAIRRMRGGAAAQERSRGKPVHRARALDKGSPEDRQRQRRPVSRARGRSPAPLRAPLAIGDSGGLRHRGDPVRGRRLHKKSGILNARRPPRCWLGRPPGPNSARPVPLGRSRSFVRGDLRARSLPEDGPTDRNRASPERSWTSSPFCRRFGRFVQILGWFPRRPQSPGRFSAGLPLRPRHSVSGLAA